MVIDNKFNFGQIVFLKTDEDQKARMVTAFKISESSILYELSCGTECSYNYDFEISKEKNILITSSN